MSSFDLARCLGTFRARKRPIPVGVEFAGADGVLNTREGPVRFQAGDALLTGVEGERWPVTKERFMATYDAIPPTEPGQAGSYVKRPITVMAWRADSPTDIPLSEGRGILHAEPGDVIVQYGAGDFAVVGASIFNKSYESFDASREP